MFDENAVPDTYPEGRQLSDLDFTRNAESSLIEYSCHYQQSFPVELKIFQPYVLSIGSAKLRKRFALIRGLVRYSSSSKLT